MPRQRRNRRPRLALLAGVMFFVCFTLTPIVYMVSGSLKTRGETYSGFAAVVPRAPTLDNYKALLFENVLFQTNIWMNLSNSARITAMTIALTLLVALPTAFAVSRTSGPLTAGLTLWLRLAQVVGGIIILIPMYLILRGIGLTNTLLGVSLAQLVPCATFASWVLISFVRQVPAEIEEAARLDGARAWQTLWLVILPLIRPAIFSVVLVVFLLSWNDFLNPLIIVSDPAKYTTTVALNTFIGQPGQVDWGKLLAFGSMACLPAVCVMVLAERHLVRGLMAGAVR